MADMDFGKLFNPLDLGRAYRAERKALGQTQQDIAQATGYRRQTIVDLEAGGNVTVLTLFSALAALGKGLTIVDARPDLEQLQGFWDRLEEN